MVDTEKIAQVAKKPTSTPCRLGSKQRASSLSAIMLSTSKIFGNLSKALKAGIPTPGYG